MFSVVGKGHAIINCNFQRHLPTIATHIRAVLTIIHPVFVVLLPIDHRQAVLQTKFVGCIPQRVNGLLIAVILLSGLKTDRVDYEMGMHMIGIAMCCNHNFKTGNCFRQLQRNLMGCFRCDVFILRKGLHHVIIHSSAVLLVQALCIHEFLQRKLRNAIDAGDQALTFVICFCFTTTIGKCAVQSSDGVRAGTVDHFYDCHYVHRFRLRISESKELTCAYAPVSSCK